MGFLDSMKISSSALTATRMRMDVITENMANMNTTRTESGEPYRRRYVVLQERQGDTSFSNVLSGAGRAAIGGGVRVAMIAEDQSEFKLDYDPSHPDADENGYVHLPNVDIVQEMTDMMSAYRVYEANLTALNTIKDMAMRTLEIGQ